MKKIILNFISILSIALSAAAYPPPPVTPTWPLPYGKIYSGGFTDADSTHDFDVLRYDLTLLPYASADILEGLALIILTPEIPNLSSIFLHEEGLTILSIMDENCNYLTGGYVPGGINIELVQPFQPGDSVQIYIEYTAPLVANYSQVGFHKWIDYTFTFAEPYGARKWFPCYDLPFDKAEVIERIWVYGVYQAAGNGILTDIVPFGSDLVYLWEETHPISTYLISFAAGPYLHLTDTSAAGIPLNYYVYPEDSAAAVYDFANTGDMLDFFSEKFGDYPFDHYGMAMSHIFNGWGAMEHQSVTTYGDNLVSGNRQYEYIVSHELSHQWWGDALTPLTFADIWLNEGFASYAEALYIEARYDTLVEHMENKAESYFQEDQYFRYPIYNPPPDYLFGSAVYNKGCWVLHMLRYVMGDDAFFAAWRNYFQNYIYGNVVTAEFQAEMETEYGSSLDWFFDEWVYQAGYPIYHYWWDILTDSTDEAQVMVDILQVQTNAPYFSMPVQFYFTDGVDDTTVTVWNNENFTYFLIDLPFSPTQMTFDPGSFILKTASQAGVENQLIIKNYELKIDNYPNPFNNSTTITFTLDRAGVVKLAVYDILGHEVTRLETRDLRLGTNSVVWNAEGCGSGVYFVRLMVDGRWSMVRKVVLMK